MGQRVRQVVVADQVRVDRDPVRHRHVRIRADQRVRHRRAQDLRVRHGAGPTGSDPDREHVRRRVGLVRAGRGHRQVVGVRQRCRRSSRSRRRPRSPSEPSPRSR